MKKQLKATLSSRPIVFCYESNTVMCIFFLLVYKMKAELICSAVMDSGAVNITELKPIPKHSFKSLVLQKSS